MKKLDTLLKKSVGNLPKPSSTSAIPTGKQAPPELGNVSATTKSLVNMLFARFMVIYGHKFKSSFETANELAIAKREWALSLAAFDEDVLVSAVEKAKQTYSWMPSIAEFIKLIELCQQSFGLPDAEQAYQEACRFADVSSQHPWSHVAVYHAGRKTGWYELRSLEKTQIWSVFKHHYQILCNRVLAGENLPLPYHRQLPEPDSQPLFALIKAWGEEYQLSDEQAQTALYYLHLPQRNPMRKRLREKSQRQYASLPFPETLEELSVLSVG